MCYENFINNNIVNTPYFRYPNINDKLILEKYFNNINNLSITKYIDIISDIDKKISSFYIINSFDKINNLNLLEFYNPIINNNIEFEKNENTIIANPIIEGVANDIIKNSTIKEFDNTIMKNFMLEKDMITKNDTVGEYSDTENYNIIIFRPINKILNNPKYVDRRRNNNNQKFLEHFLYNK